MSSAQTSLERSTGKPRSRYGNTGCAGCLRLVFGLQYINSMSMRRTSVRNVPPAHRDAVAAQQIAPHAAAGKRVLEVQLDEAPHQAADRPG